MKYLKFLIIPLSIIIACLLLYPKGCSYPELPSKAKPNHDSIYKSEKKQDSIINKSTILENKLKLKDDSLLLLKKLLAKKPKHTYDSLRVADTSCQNSLIILYNSFSELNQLNDSIISNNILRLKNDSILIATLFDKVKTKQDHISIDSNYIANTVPELIKSEFKRGKKVGRKQGVIGTLIVGGVIVVGAKLIN